MKMNPIARKHAALQAKIAALHSKVVALQEECDHNGVHVTYRGDTGNYDRSADCYWIEWKCPHCGYQWNTPQDHESYDLEKQLGAVRIGR